MKELKRQRLVLLSKLDSLLDKCNCSHTSEMVVTCSNCKEIQRLGDELQKNLVAQKKKKGVVQIVIEPGKKKREYPPGLTEKEYLRFKSLLLSDEQIGEIYGVAYHIIATYKKEFKLYTEYPKTRLTKLEAKRIVIRERKRINKKYSEKKEVS